MARRVFVFPLISVIFTENVEIRPSFFARLQKNERKKATQTWLQPSLGLVEFGGSGDKSNNIVLNTNTDPNRGVSMHAQ